MTSPINPKQFDSVIGRLTFEEGLIFLDRLMENLVTQVRDESTSAFDNDDEEKAFDLYIYQIKLNQIKLLTSNL